MADPTLNTVDQGLGHHRPLGNHAPLGGDLLRPLGARSLAVLNLETFFPTGWAEVSAAAPPANAPPADGELQPMSPLSASPPATVARASKPNSSVPLWMETPPAVTIADAVAIAPPDPSLPPSRLARTADPGSPAPSSSRPIPPDQPSAGNDVAGEVSAAHVDNVLPLSADPASTTEIALSSSTAKRPGDRSESATPQQASVVSPQAARASDSAPELPVVLQLTPTEFYQAASDRPVDAPITADSGRRDRPLVKPGASAAMPGSRPSALVGIDHTDLQPETTQPRAVDAASAVAGDDSARSMKSAVSHESVDEASTAIATSDATDVVQRSSTDNDVFDDPPSSEGLVTEISQRSQPPDRPASPTPQAQAIVNFGKEGEGTAVAKTSPAPVAENPSESVATAAHEIQPETIARTSDTAAAPIGGRVTPSPDLAETTTPAAPSVSATEPADSPSPTPAADRPAPTAAHPNIVPSLSRSVASPADTPAIAVNQSPNSPDVSAAAIAHRPPQAAPDAPQSVDLVESPNAEAVHRAVATPPNPTATAPQQSPVFESEALPDTPRSETVEPSHIPSSPPDGVLSPDNSDNTIRRAVDTTQTAATVGDPGNALATTAHHPESHGEVPADAARGDRPSVAAEMAASQFDDVQRAPAAPQSTPSAIARSLAAPLLPEASTPESHGDVPADAGAEMAESEANIIQREQEASPTMPSATSASSAEVTAAADSPTEVVRGPTTASDAVAQSTVHQETTPSALHPPDAGDNPPAAAVSAPAAADAAALQRQTATTAAPPAPPEALPLTDAIPEPMNVPRDRASDPAIAPSATASTPPIARPAETVATAPLDASVPFVPENALAEKPTPDTVARRLDETAPFPTGESPSAPRPVATEAIAPETVSDSTVSHDSSHRSVGETGAVEATTDDTIPTIAADSNAAATVSVPTDPPSTAIAQTHRSDSVARATAPTAIAPTSQHPATPTSVAEDIPSASVTAEFAPLPTAPTYTEPLSEEPSVTMAPELPADAALSVPASGATAGEGKAIAVAPSSPPAPIQRSPAAPPSTSVTATTPALEPPCPGQLDTSTASSHAATTAEAAIAPRAQVTTSSPPSADLPPLPETASLEMLARSTEPETTAVETSVPMDEAMASSATSEATPPASLSTNPPSLPETASSEMLARSHESEPPVDLVSPLADEVMVSPPTSEANASILLSADLPSSHEITAPEMLARNTELEPTAVETSVPTDPDEAMASPTISEVTTPASLSTELPPIHETASPEMLVRSTEPEPTTAESEPTVASTPIAADGETAIAPPTETTTAATEIAGTVQAQPSQNIPSLQREPADGPPQTLTEPPSTPEVAPERSPLASQEPRQPQTTAPPLASSAVASPQSAAVATDGSQDSFLDSQEAVSDRDAVTFVPESVTRSLADAATPGNLAETLLTQAASASTIARSGDTSSPAIRESSQNEVASPPDGDGSSPSHLPAVIPHIPPAPPAANVTPASGDLGGTRRSLTSPGTVDSSSIDPATAAATPLTASAEPIPPAPSAAHAPGQSVGTTIPPTETIARATEPSSGVDEGAIASSRPSNPNVSNGGDPAASTAIARPFSSATVDPTVPSSLAATSAISIAESGTDHPSAAITRTLDQTSASTDKAVSTDSAIAGSPSQPTAAAPTVEPVHPAASTATSPTNDASSLASEDPKSIAESVTDHPSAAIARTHDETTNAASTAPTTADIPETALNSTLQSPSASDGAPLPDQSAAVTDLTPPSVAATHSPHDEASPSFTQDDTNLYRAPRTPETTTAEPPIASSPNPDLAAFPAPDTVSLEGEITASQTPAIARSPDLTLPNSDPTSPRRQNAIQQAPDAAVAIEPSAPPPAESAPTPPMPAATESAPPNGTANTTGAEAIAASGHPALTTAPLPPTATVAEVAALDQKSVAPSAPQASPPLPEAVQPSPPAATDEPETLNSPAIQRHPVDQSPPTAQADTSFPGDGPPQTAPRSPASASPSSEERRPTAPTVDHQPQRAATPPEPGPMPTTAPRSLTVLRQATDDESPGTVASIPDEPDTAWPSPDAVVSTAVPREPTPSPPPLQRSSGMTDGGPSSQLSLPVILTVGSESDIEGDPSKSAAPPLSPLSPPATASIQRTHSPIAESSPPTLSAQVSDRPAASPTAPVPCEIDRSSPTSPLPPNSRLPHTTPSATVPSPPTTRPPASSPSSPTGSPSSLGVLQPITVLRSLTSEPIRRSPASSVTDDSAQAPLPQSAPPSPREHANPPSFHPSAATSAIADTPTQWNNLAELVASQSPLADHTVTSPAVSASQLPTSLPDAMPTAAASSTSPPSVATPYGDRAANVSAGAHSSNHHTTRVQAQFEAFPPSPAAPPPPVIQADEDTPFTTITADADDTLTQQQTFERLAQETYLLLRQRLAIEQERHGRVYPDRF